MTVATPLDCVLGFVRTIEAGGGAAEIRPFLADDFRLVETADALHVLNAPSPAATASLAIGEYISAKVPAA